MLNAAGFSQFCHSEFLFIAQRTVVSEFARLDAAVSFLTATLEIVCCPNVSPFLASALISCASCLQNPVVVL